MMIAHYNFISGKIGSSSLTSVAYSGRGTKCYDDDDDDLPL